MAHFRCHWSLILLKILFVLLLGMPRGCVEEAQGFVQANVTLTNQMGSGQVVSLNCMLNDTTMDSSSGFLAGSAATLRAQMTPEDIIFCNFTLGFVPTGFIQVAVECDADGTCSAASMDFSSQGAYLNLVGWEQPSGRPDIPWSSLLPHS